MFGGAIKSVREGLTVTLSIPSGIHCFRSDDSETDKGADSEFFLNNNENKELRGICMLSCIPQSGKSSFHADAYTCEHPVVVPGTAKPSKTLLASKH